jgi:hypothetical protein
MHSFSKGIYRYAKLFIGMHSEKQYPAKKKVCQIILLLAIHLIISIPVDNIATTSPLQYFIPRAV